ncbi:MAG: hypothetical protein HY331_19440 [Chloroflexi bacterium]|nr:hypothetical protein [Chloroflexota bacterium]
MNGAIRTAFNSRGGRMPRRHLLVAAGVLGMSGGLAALAACSPTAQAPAPQPTAPPAPTAQPTAKPAVQPTTAPVATSKSAVQGGTLVVGAEGLGDN